jgi:hypothetical protein
LLAATESTKDHACIIVEGGWNQRQAAWSPMSSRRAGTGSASGGLCCSLWPPTAPLGDGTMGGLRPALLLGPATLLGPAQHYACLVTAPANQSPVSSSSAESNGDDRDERHPPARHCPCRPSPRPSPARFQKPKPPLPPFPLSPPCHGRPCVPAPSRNWWKPWQIHTKNYREGERDGPGFLQPPASIVCSSSRRPFALLKTERRASADLLRRRAPPWPPSMPRPGHRCSPRQRRRPPPTSRCPRAVAVVEERTKPPSSDRRRRIAGPAPAAAALRHPRAGLPPPSPRRRRLAPAPPRAAAVAAPAAAPGAGQREDRVSRGIFLSVSHGGLAIGCSRRYFGPAARQVDVQVDTGQCTSGKDFGL